jgi:hypothetical protein
MISNLDYNTALTPLEASHAATTTSDKYGFVSTRDIISHLEPHGFVPRSVEICRANSAETRGFQKHVVRLRHNDIMPSAGDEGQPEIVIINSHDGKSSLRIALGFFRFVCSNGIIAGTSAFQTRLIHRQANVEAAHQAVQTIVQRAPEMLEGIKAMRSTKLHPLVEMTFVMEAAKLRWDEPSEDQLNALGLVNREEDSRNDLWSVFNRVQETASRGSRRHGIRRISSPSADVQFNQKLWDLSQYFVNN